MTRALRLAPALVVLCVSGRATAASGPILFGPNRASPNDLYTAPLEHGQVGTPVLIYPPGSTDSRVAGVADMDGDGLFDIVVGDGSQSKLQWLRRTNTTPGAFETTLRAIDSAVPSGPIGPAVVADFDGNGSMDVVVSMEAPAAVDKLWVYLSSGGASPTFTRHEVATGISSLVVLGGKCAGDWNSDGKMDLAVLGPRSGGADGHVSIFLNTGSGARFSSSSRVQVNGTSSLMSGPGAIWGALACSDADSDGLVDLWALGNQDRVQFLRNLGGTTFAAMVPAADALLLTYDKPLMDAIDVDRDGAADLILSTGSDADSLKVRIYKGTGAGLLTSTTPLQTLVGFGSAVAAPVDVCKWQPAGSMCSNGVADDGIETCRAGLCRAGTPTKELPLLFGSDKTTGFMSSALAAAGQLTRVASFPNVGAPATQMANSAQLVGVGDLDGDGLDDVVFTSWPGRRISWFKRLDLGAGSFDFENPRTVDSYTPAGEPRPGVLGDLDGDGDLDFIGSYESVSFPQGNQDRIMLYAYRNDGQGNFTRTQANTGLPHASTSAVAGKTLLHADADGLLDLVVFAPKPTNSSGDVQIWLFTNQGTAASPWQPFNSNGRTSIPGTHVLMQSGGTRWGSVASGLFDGDAAPDLVAIGNNKKLYFLRGLGGGAFNVPSSPVQTLSSLTFGQHVLARADVSGDGKLDILLTPADTSLGSELALFWYAGGGDGTFPATANQKLGLWGTNVSAGVGECTYKNDGVACSDGNFCTVGDVCQAGECKGTTPTGPCTAADIEKEIAGLSTYGSVIASSATGVVEVGSNAVLTGSLFSNGTVEVKAGGRVQGSVQSIANVVLRTGAVVTGNVTTRGQATLESGASITGNLQQGAPIFSAETEGLETMLVRRGMSAPTTGTGSLSTFPGVPGQYTFTGSSITMAQTVMTPQQVRFTGATTLGSGATITVGSTGILQIIADADITLASGASLVNQRSDVDTLVLAAAANVTIAAGATVTGALIYAPNGTVTINGTFTGAVLGASVVFGASTTPTGVSDRLKRETLFALSERTLRRRHFREYTESTIELRDYLLANPTSPQKWPLRMWIGDNYMMSFDYENAAAEFEQIVADVSVPGTIVFGPDNLPLGRAAYKSAADARRLDGRYAEAVDLLEMALQNFSTATSDGGLHVVRGLAAEKGGLLAVATSSFQQAIGPTLAGQRSDVSNNLSAGFVGQQGLCRVGSTRSWINVDRLVLIDQLTAALAGAVPNTSSLRSLASPCNFAFTVPGGDSVYGAFEMVAAKIDQGAAFGPLTVTLDPVSHQDSRQVMHVDGWQGTYLPIRVDFLLKRTAYGWEWTGVRIPTVNESTPYPTLFDDVLALPPASPAVTTFPPPSFPPGTLELCPEANPDDLPRTCPRPPPIPPGVSPLLPCDVCANPPPLRMKLHAPWPKGECMQAGGFLFHPFEGASPSDCNSDYFYSGGSYYGQNGHYDDQCFAIDFNQWDYDLLSWPSGLLAYTNTVESVPVVSVAYGQVRAGTCANPDLSENQNWFEVDHGKEGYRSEYVHLAQSCDISAEMKIGQGQRIGWNDNTGDSFMAHLHFHLLDTCRYRQGTVGNSVPLDPMEEMSLGLDDNSTRVTSRITLDDPDFDGVSSATDNCCLSNPILCDPVTFECSQPNPCACTPPNCATVPSVIGKSVVDANAAFAARGFTSVLSRMRQVHTEQCTWNFLVEAQECIGATLSKSAPITIWTRACLPRSQR